jgi:hypothetical protein
MDRGTFTRVGWRPPASKLSEEGWLHTGATILALERATPWLWGDWYLAGGAIHALPADWQGPTRHTLENYGSVAKRYSHSRRRELVSFTHHAELAALSEAEQDELLDWCATHRASMEALRAERRRRADALLPPKPTLRVTVTKIEAEPVAVRVRVIKGVERLPARVVLAPSQSDDGSIPVTVSLPAELHAQARAAAEVAGLGLAAWIIGLIERACSP